MLTHTFFSRVPVRKDGVLTLSARWRPKLQRKNGDENQEGRAHSAAPASIPRFDKRDANHPTPVMPERSATEDGEKGALTGSWCKYYAS